MPSLHGSCAVALDAQRRNGALLDAWRARQRGSLSARLGVAISVGAFPTALDRDNRAAAIALRLVTSRILRCRRNALEMHQEHMHA
jgi:hypothetical protein